MIDASILLNLKMYLSYTFLPHVLYPEISTALMFMFLPLNQVDQEEVALISCIYVPMAVDQHIPIIWAVPGKLYSLYVCALGCFHHLGLEEDALVSCIHSICPVSLELYSLDVMHLAECDDLEKCALYS